MDQDICAYVTPCGVCTKMYHKGFEISIAQELPGMSSAAFQLGTKLPRAEIRVYKDTKNVSLEFETLRDSDRDEYSPSGKTLMLLLIEIDSRF